MEHPWPIQVCTIVCIIYDAQRGQGDKGNTLKNTSMKNPNLFCNNFPLNVGKIKEYYVKEERHLYCFRFAQLKKQIVLACIVYSVQYTVLACIVYSVQYTVRYVLPTDCATVMSLQTSVSWTAQMRIPKWRACWSKIPLLSTMPLYSDNAILNNLSSFTEGMQ